MKTDFTCQGYSSSHPWYYLLGGITLMPSDIIACVKTSGYKGYLEEDIGRANNRSEPGRSESLRALKAKVLADLWRDLSRYRALVCALRNHRKERGYDAPHECADLHVNISLKHNHLYNDFAHLIALNEMLEKQPDLFGW